MQYQAPSRETAGCSDEDEEHARVVYCDDASEQEKPAIAQVCMTLKDVEASSYTLNALGNVFYAFRTFAGA